MVINTYLGLALAVLIEPAIVLALPTELVFAVNLHKRASLPQWPDKALHIVGMMTIHPYSTPTVPHE